MWRAAAAGLGQLLILGLVFWLAGISWGDSGAGMVGAWWALMVLWAAGEAGLQAPTRRADPADLDSVLGAGAWLALVLVCSFGARGSDWCWSAQVLGLLMFAAGAALRCAAVHTLGEEFRASTHTHGELVERGVYRFMRHPAELGLLLCSLGTALALASWWGLALFTLVVLPLSAWRVRREDCLLSERDGLAHQRYTHDVGAWWRRRRV